MQFIKMHGLGNDFIIVDARNGAATPTFQQIVELSDRKTGVGCDQFIVLLSPEGEGEDGFMHIYNADGSESEACGNATRCVADYLMADANKDALNIRTVAGILVCTKEADGQITVDMGKPRFGWNEIPLSKEVDTLSVPFDGFDLPAGAAANIGNPHIVFFLNEDVEKFPVAQIGPQIETHPLFPQKTNVEFCNVIDRATIRMRVWERGVGITQACGSGACATAVTAMRRGLVDRKCTVGLDGGTLRFHWREEDDHILMTGPVAYVFKGTAL